FESSTGKNRLPWVIAAAALVMASGAGFVTRDMWMPRPPLELTSREVDGKLEIRWNPAAVRDAGQASVLINDGDNSQTLEINLDSSQLGSGVLPYYPKSQHVKGTFLGGRQPAVTRENARLSGKSPAGLRKARAENGKWRTMGPADGSERLKA